MAAVDLFPDRPLAADEMRQIHKLIDGVTTWRLEVECSLTRVFEVEAEDEDEAWDLYRDGKAREVFGAQHDEWPEERKWTAVEKAS